VLQQADVRAAVPSPGLLAWAANSLHFPAQQHGFAECSSALPGEPSTLTLPVSWIWHPSLELQI